jgi:hypothetical protein
MVNAQHPVVVVETNTEVEQHLVIAASLPSQRLNDGRAELCGR